MDTRSQQISSPLVLPLLASILTTGVIASLFLLPPPKASFSVEQLVLRATLDLAIAACVHLATVWTIWRLLREYLEPSVGTLALHLWAVVAWLPLIIILDAERSLWITCIVPWAFANAMIFLNLWSALSAEEEPARHAAHPLFYIAPVSPLWRTLLPYVLTVITAQGGFVCAASGRPWSAAALFSAGVLMFLVRHPVARSNSQSRRRFSRAAVLQTAAVFFLITTALTPFLQKAYGLRSLRSLLAIVPRPISRPAIAHIPSSGASGIILTLPPKPHPAIKPPTSFEPAHLSPALPKPVTIPFDGAYWYFKAPDTRPRPDARIQRGDPISATIRSTDYLPLAMEAHQPLPTPIAADCCHALRLDLINGDTRPGLIQIELRLKNTSRESHITLSLGSLSLRSSQVQHIPLDRPPVHESLRFPVPATFHGQQFNEITVDIKPSSARALAGSKIAIQDFVLVP